MLKNRLIIDAEYYFFPFFPLGTFSGEGAGGFHFKSEYVAWSITLTLIVL